MVRIMQHRHSANTETTTKMPMGTQAAVSCRFIGEIPLVAATKSTSLLSKSKLDELHQICIVS